MAKRKLTDRLKKKILENPYRLKQSDYAGAALTYLHRVRGSRKAAKTKAQKKKYKEPKTKKAQGQIESIEHLIEILAKGKKMTVKQFRKKFPAEIKELEIRQKLVVEREVNYAKLDVRFAGKGKSFYLMNRRQGRVKILFLLTMLKRILYETELIYPHVFVEISIYLNKLTFEFPTPSEMKDVVKNSTGDIHKCEPLLEYVETNYPVRFIRRG